MSRKVCVITGSRAEYGLLRPLMQEICEDKQLKLEVIVTGMHLSPEFGSTHQIITNDGFHIDRKVEMVLSVDSDSGISKSVGLGVIGFTDALSDLNPELIVVLGDRYEVFASVIAALFIKIPILHIHGGEITEGSIDESIRHAITKMSHIHCVAAEEYRQRVIQLGESPGRVYCVGGLGVDVIKNTNLLSREDLEKELDYKFKNKNLLITYHPVSYAPLSIKSQMRELFSALKELSDTGFIFTLPNSDAGGREITSMIRSFVAENVNARAYPSLGQLKYLSLMSHCDGVVGNSSSALLEAPTLKKGAVNIGNRQVGRLHASSVINCGNICEEIRKGFQILYSSEFKAQLTNTINPYGNGGASKKVVEIIKNLDLSNIMQKPFYSMSSLDFSIGFEK